MLHASSWLLNEAKSFFLPDVVCQLVGFDSEMVQDSKGSLVELVEQQSAMSCVVGSIPAGSALDVWPWTSVQNSLVG